MIDKLSSYYGFSRMPFGRDLAPSMLHRHTAHNEALARIDWCIAERRIGVITGDSQDRVKQIAKISALVRREMFPSAIKQTATPLIHPKPLGLITRGNISVTERGRPTLPQKTDGGISHRSFQIIAKPTFAGVRRLEPAFHDFEQKNLGYFVRIIWIG